MRWLEKPYVCGLDEAENHLIQVLLEKEKLSLQKSQAGVHLKVEFDSHSPTIRRREAKDSVREDIAEFARQSAEYQNELDDVLLGTSEEPFVPRKEGFVFRYGSGGVLPILQIDNTEYYCLFYRDVFPVGWNIANGGCDSVAELLNPHITIKRELCEELIILDLDGTRDLVFDLDEGERLSMPVFTQARQLWSRIYRDKSIEKFDRSEPLKMKWVKGPDVLTIKHRDADPINRTDGFVNINALDYGIEFDRIAKINIQGAFNLFDGELINRELLNRPIGLFEAAVLNEQLARATPGREYRPQRLFHWGKEQAQGTLEDAVTGDYIPRLIAKGLRKATHAVDYEGVEQKFDLCPVTRQLIKRYISPVASPVGADSSQKEVFLSYSTLDEEFASRLYKDLTRRNIRCWKWNEDARAGAGLWRQIDETIRRADNVILIASRDSLNSPAVWREVERAIAQEDERTRQVTEPRRRVNVLIPILLDDYLHKYWDHPLKVDVEAKAQVVAQGWDRDPKVYSKSIERLIEGIQR